MPMSRYLIILVLSVIFSLSLLKSIGFAETPPEPLFGTPKNYKAVLVLKILSADTFILETGEKIKLIGLTSPEPPKKKDVMRDEHGFIIEEKDPTISFEQQAFEFTKTLIEGKRVRLEFDAQKKNEDYQTLAYAFLENDQSECSPTGHPEARRAEGSQEIPRHCVPRDEGSGKNSPTPHLFVNAEILRQGFADLRIRPPNTKYAQVLREAYQEAHKEKRGLHGE